MGDFVARRPEAGQKGRRMNLFYSPRVQVDLEPFPALRACQARVTARPAVQEAPKAEGLLQQ